MKLTRFEINEDLLERPFKKKNIVFFKLIDLNKYENVLYLYDNNSAIDSIDKDMITIITTKNGRPMSLPVNIFISVLGIEMINRETILSSSEIKRIVQKKITVINKKDFSRSIKYKKVLKKTENFWKKFNGIENISILLCKLKSGESIALEQGELYLKNDLFHLKKHMFERTIAPEEAFSYVIKFINKDRNTIDLETIEFLMNDYAN